MDIIILGVFTAFNLVILKLKFDQQRYEDLGLDLLAIIVLNMFFEGTFQGMAVAMVASFIVSLFLYFNTVSSSDTRKKYDWE